MTAEYLLSTLTKAGIRLNSGTLNELVVKELFYLIKQVVTPLLPVPGTFDSIGNR